MNLPEEAGAASALAVLFRPPSPPPLWRGVVGSGGAAPVAEKASRTQRGQIIPCRCSSFSWRTLSSDPNVSNHTIPYPGYPGDDLACPVLPRKSSPRCDGCAVRAHSYGGRPAQWQFTRAAGRANSRRSSAARRLTSLLPFLERARNENRNRRSERRSSHGTERRPSSTSTTIPSPTQPNPTRPRTLTPGGQQASGRCFLNEAAAGRDRGGGN